MKLDKSIVVGLKFYVGTVDMEGISTQDFVKHVSFKFDLGDPVEGIIDETGLYKGENGMTAKYYDDEEGYMYVTFDKEVSPEDLPFFSEDEMIFKKIDE